MGVFIRKGSPFYQLWLERPNGAPAVREATKIRHDAALAVQRRENRQLAEALYHERMTELAKGEAAPEAKPGRTFGEQAAWYTTHRLPQRKGKEREAPLIPKLVAVFKSVPLGDMTQTLVTEKWITPRRTTPTAIVKGKRTAARTVQAGARTINREVAVIKAIVQSGVPDYLASSPLYGMPLLKTSTPKRRLMAPDEEARLLAVMAPDDKALFLLALDSLVRMGDVLDLRRRDDHGKTAWIGDPKAGGGFEVPISTRARKALDAWYRKSDLKISEYIFARRRRAKTERDRRNGIRQMLERYCRDASPPVPFGRKNGGLSFHWATRRTGLTRMLTRKVDLGTAQKIGRWRTADVVLGVYHELIDDVAHRAVNAVGPVRVRRERISTNRDKA